MHQHRYGYGEGEFPVLSCDRFSGPKEINIYTQVKQDQKPVITEQPSVQLVFETNNKQDGKNDAQQYG